MKDCDFCSGRFLRYTTKLEYGLPARYCSECGKQLVTKEPPIVTQYDTETGKPYRLEATLVCPDWKPPKRDWVHPRTIMESKHDIRGCHASYESDDELRWRT